MVSSGDYKTQRLLLDRKIVNMPKATPNEVIARSLHQARSYLTARNFGRAFAHFLVVLRLSPTYLKDARIQEDFIFALGQWGQELERRKKTKDLFHCYEQALELLPSSETLQSNFGAHLFRLGFLDEAATYFSQAIQQDSTSVCTRDYMDNIASALVERWHFAMLNCTTRNLSFQNAIQRAIVKGHQRVLDIGTGTGILSMFAVAANASAVHACEMSKAMHIIAVDALASNCMLDRVHLMHAKSTELEIPTHIPERVSLVITETFDAALFGEGIIETLIHAWKELLIPPLVQASCKDTIGGRVIPGAASVWACPIECQRIRQYTRLIESQASLFQLANASLLMKQSADDPYTTERLSEIRGGYRKLALPVKILEVDFNSPEALNNLVQGQALNYDVSCCDKGYVDAYAVWFDLHLDEMTTISTNPDSKICWEQAIYPSIHFSQNETEVYEGSVLKLTVVYDGCLKVTPRFPSTNNLPEEEIPVKSSYNAFVPSNDLLMLNDVTYQCSLHSALNSYFDCGNRPSSVLINSSFPLSAILVLNLGAIRVGCLAKKFDSDVISHIVGCEDLDTNRICFETEETLISATPSYSILLTDVVDSCGLINPEIICEITLLREYAIQRPFCIIPSKLRCVAVLIDSSTLAERNYVTDDAHTLNFKIAEHINAYRVSHHQDLDLNTLPHTKLSDPGPVLELDFVNYFSDCNTGKDDASVPSFINQQCLSVAKIKTSGKLTAIAYWFELQMAENNVVSTMDSKTHWHQAAIVLGHERVVNVGQTMELETQFNNGHLRISLQV